MTILEKLKKRLIGETICDVGYRDDPTQVLVLYMENGDEFEISEYGQAGEIRFEFNSVEIEDD